MHQYFDLLRTVFDEFDFNSYPDRTYNMDETGVPLELCPPIKVVAQKRQKKFVIAHSDQSQKIWSLVVVVPAVRLFLLLLLLPLNS